MAGETALYRINGGEVLKISPTGFAFSDADVTYFGVASGASYPHGTDLVNVSLGDSAVRRQEGFAKIYVTASNVVQNATSTQIATWASAEASDEAQQDASAAVNLLQDHPMFRKAFKLIIKAINTTRTSAGLTSWTTTQIRNFISANLSKDD